MSSTTRTSARIVPAYNLLENAATGAAEAAPSTEAAEAVEAAEAAQAAEGLMVCSKPLLVCFRDLPADLIMRKF
jgi:hypothetical protein